MRTEYREVTVRQKVFIADDGTEFFSEEACGDHEYNQIAKSFKCYDQHYNEVDICKAVIVNLPTEEVVKNFMWVSDIEDTVTDGIDGPGCYIYAETDRGGWWINAEEALCRIIGGVPIRE